MKYLVLALMLLASPLNSQESKFDIGPLLDNLSACSVITHKGDLLAGGCFAPFTWRWGSLNGGILWKANKDDKGVGGGLVSFAVRADKAWGWLWRKADLEKKGVVTHFVVPRFEAGPTGGYHKSSGWFVGGFLNMKWPF